MQQEPLEIYLETLEPDTVAALVEEYILREGTDYGAHEVPLETKVRQVLKQLSCGDAKLFFDPASESVTLVRKDDRLITRSMT